MQFPWEFETHLTVRLADGQTVESLRAAPAAHGLKCTHIVLARGRSASQPMLTRDGRGTLDGQLAEAEVLRGALGANGFLVSRVKVEAAPWNRGVPLTDADGATQPADRYFEHHVKLLLDDQVDLHSLAELATRNGAHLSHNALRRRDDGRLERFVTQRCRGAGRDTARPRLEALLADLRGRRYEVIDVEEEFVVYDSDLSLDAGWLEAEAVTP